MIQNQDIKEGTHEGVPYTYYDSKGSDESDSERIALIAPGMGGSRKDDVIKTLAQRLGEERISSVCFDIQDNEEVLPVEEIVERYQKMGEFVRGKGYQPGQTGVFGTSLSGLPAVIAASEMGSESLGLKSPLLYFDEMVEGKIGEEGLRAWKRKGCIEKDGNKLPYELYEQWKSVDKKELAGSLARNQTQVRIVQGGADTRVPLPFTRKFYDLLRGQGADVDMRVIDEADHEYTKPEHFAEAVGYLAQGGEK